MEKERWHKVEALFQAALERPAVDRTAFLDEECSGDVALRKEVESLLQAATDTRFLESPAVLSDTTATHTDPASGDRELLDRLQRALGSVYMVERELGGGGMARIFVATDSTLGRRVVLKVLAPELAAGIDAERFHREVRLAASLQHPHVVPLHAAGQADGLLYYTMPFVAGESLRHRLDRKGPLPIGEAVRLLREVADALGFAHRQGIIHRDLKPANILLSEGHALVADFGIAKALVAATAGPDTTATAAIGESLTTTGLVLGTPMYMAPEQAVSDQAMDHRADLYALGCLAYELLMGRPPFVAPSVRALMTAHLIDAPVPITTHRPEVPAALERLVMQLLAKDPAQRPQHAEDVLHALEAAEISAPVPTAPGLTSRKKTWPWRAGLAVAALILLVAAVAMLRRGGGTPRIIAPASSIAVLPFTPSGPDTALSRLGRDLVFTLSAELDGLGGIRVVDAHTVIARSRTEALDAAHDWSAEARGLGAGSVVQGSLVRVGGDVRLDLALRGADSGAAPLARATVTASPDSVAVLTDSAARALLSQIWSRGTPPTPSLDAALRTRSVEALRAFLQGEGEITHGSWDAAAQSYQRAMDADTAFWMASARYVYARNWTLLEPSSSVMTRLERHLGDLPERERLSTEAIMHLSGDTIMPSIEASREASQRYPDSWFGWLLYGDALLHLGPVVGHTLAEARGGFEHAVALNADLIPGWEHLMLIMLLQGDTAGTARALKQLTRLKADPILTAEGYGDRMLQFRYLDAIERGDTGGIGVLVDSLARDPAPAAIPDGTFYDPYRYGWFAEQILVSRKTLAAGGSPERQRLHRMLLALSWGGRGAWDSMLVSLDRSAAEGTDSSAALRAYGLAAVGVWLDALDPREATVRRQPALQAARADDTARAEVAWADGVLAAGRHDRRALAESRAAVRHSGDRASSALDRSLGALDAALRGATGEAAEQMAALEWEEAALSAPDYTGHPLTLALDRLAAAQWLLASGNPEEALRLLTWVDGAFFLHPSAVYGLMFMGLADLDRGRAEERLGHGGVAAEYYRRFLRRYDMPVSRHVPLVEEAKERLRP